MVRGGAYAGTGVVADDVATLGAADVDIDDDDAATSSLLILIGEHLLGLL